VRRAAKPPLRKPGGFFIAEQECPAGRSDFPWLLKLRLAAGSITIY
jgi:hypothetical protein